MNSSAAVVQYVHCLADVRRIVTKCTRRMNSCSSGGGSDRQTTTSTVFRFDTEQTSADSDITQTSPLTVYDVVVTIYTSYTSINIHSPYSTKWRLLTTWRSYTIRTYIRACHPVWTAVNIHLAWHCDYCRRYKFTYYYTLVRKKVATIFLPLTFPSVDRF